MESSCAKDTQTTGDEAWTEGEGAACHDWRIPNFSKLPQLCHHESSSSTRPERLLSKPFPSAGLTWRVMLYPRGNVQNHKNANGCVSVYVELIDVHQRGLCWWADVQFKFTVLHATIPSRSVAKQSSYKFERTMKDRGFNSLITLDKLLDKKEGFLLDDVFHLRTEMTVDIPDCFLRKNLRRERRRCLDAIRSHIDSKESQDEQRRRLMLERQLIESAARTQRKEERRQQQKQKQKDAKKDRLELKNYIKKMSSKGLSPQQLAAVEAIGETESSCSSESRSHEASAAGKRKRRKRKRKKKGGAESKSAEDASCSSSMCTPAPAPAGSETSSASSPALVEAESESAESESSPKVGAYVISPSEKARLLENGELRKTALQPKRKSKRRNKKKNKKNNAAATSPTAPQADLTPAPTRTPPTVPETPAQASDDDGFTLVKKRRSKKSKPAAGEPRTPGSSKNTSSSTSHGPPSPSIRPPPTRLRNNAANATASPPQPIHRHAKSSPARRQRSDRPNGVAFSKGNGCGTKSKGHPPIAEKANAKRVQACPVLPRIPPGPRDKAPYSVWAPRVPSPIPEPFPSPQSAIRNGLMPGGDDPMSEQSQASGSVGDSTAESLTASPRQRTISPPGKSPEMLPLQGRHLLGRPPLPTRPSKPLNAKAPPFEGTALFGPLVTGTPSPAPSPPLKDPARTDDFQHANHILWNAGGGGLSGSLWGCGMGLGGLPGASSLGPIGGAGERHRQRGPTKGGYQPFGGGGIFDGSAGPSLVHGLGTSTW